MAKKVKNIEALCRKTVRAFLDGDPVVRKILDDAVMVGVRKLELRPERYGKKD